MFDKSKAIANEQAVATFHPSGCPSISLTEWLLGDIETEVINDVAEPQGRC